MPLTLYVDSDAWHGHHAALRGEQPGIVPVAKGNGYGFTVPVLARAAARLGVDQLAVGTPQEAAAVSEPFTGDVLILDPQLGGAEPRLDEGRIVRTASSVDAVRKLAGRRMVLDCRSSMLRQGIGPHEIAEARAALGGQPVDGFSLHLPLDRPGGSDPVGETLRWVRALAAEGFQVPVMYVSHLRPEEIAALKAQCPGTLFRPRIGTALWLGDKTAVQARATVLDAFPVASGERLGYRQRRSRRDGWLVMVSGGTVQGVGLEAPRTLRGTLPRAKELVRCGLATVNRTRSPFCWQGRKQWFAEPPHMLVSMLYLPRRMRPPEPGAELTAELRHTLTHFDQVVMR
jgi:Alanine racemase, N-terminal domain